MPDDQPIPMADARAADLADSVQYDGAGLVPAIAQCGETGRVLMLAWMSRDALVATLTTGRVTYYSRSRGKLWRKGDTSGNIQRAERVYLDCDGDSVLLSIHQTGPACHTGRQSCFYRGATVGGWLEMDA